MSSRRRQGISDIPREETVIHIPSSPVNEATYKRLKARAFRTVSVHARDEQDREQILAALGIEEP